MNTEQNRRALIQRRTGETDVKLQLELDGAGHNELQTGVPFLDHMLDLLATHGQFNLSVQAKGDLEVDAHHTTEDVGICFGQALKEALGDKKGIRRYGNAFVPMDEALAQVTVDLSGRAYVAWHVQFPQSQVGTFDTELVQEMLSKLAFEAGLNLHVQLHYGHNTHHMIEAIYKATGRALAEAVSFDPRIEGVLSTKGML